MALNPIAQLPLSNAQLWYFVPYFCKMSAQYRAVSVRRPENPRDTLKCGGHNLPPLVEIGLTELSNSGGAKAPPSTPANDSSEYR